MPAVTISLESDLHCRKCEVEDCDEPPAISDFVLNLWLRQAGTLEGSQQLGFKRGVRHISRAEPQVKQLAQSPDSLQPTRWCFAEQPTNVGQRPSITSDSCVERFLKSVSFDEPSKIYDRTRQSRNCDRIDGGDVGGIEIAPMDDVVVVGALAATGYCDLRRLNNSLGYLPKPTGGSA